MLLCLYIHRMGFDLQTSTETLYLFPPLKWSAVRHEYCIVPGKALSYSQAYKNFKTLLCFAGLDPSKFALHSPRRGGTTEAFRSGVPDHVIDLQGRWKSPGTKYRYLKLTDREISRKLARLAKYWYSIIFYFCCVDLQWAIFDIYVLFFVLCSFLRFWFAVLAVLSVFFAPLRFAIFCSYAPFPMVHTIQRADFNA